MRRSRTTTCRLQQEFSIQTIFYVKAYTFNTKYIPALVVVESLEFFFWRWLCFTIQTRKLSFYKNFFKNFFLRWLNAQTQKIHAIYISSVSMPHIKISNFATSTSGHMVRNRYSYWRSLLLLFEKTLFNWLQQCRPIGPFLIPRGNSVTVVW